MGAGKMTRQNVAGAIVAICVLFCALPAARAATILKLNLGNIGPDIQMTNLGLAGTVNDGIAGTSGDQNTAIDFTGALSANPDITTDTASFSLSNLITSGPA